MNIAMKRTMLAVAVGMFCASASVYAQESGLSQSYSLDQSSTHTQNVEFDKKLSLLSDIEITGDPTVTGAIDVDSAAIAIVDNRQKNHDNMAVNTLLENDASIADDVGSAASGNLGFNVAAGDNNQQDNAAALAATDASFVFGMADAEVFVNQLGHDNATVNTGSPNSASVGGNAFNAASGNIGVNVTAGNNNQQKNALAASVATSRFSQASVDSSQYSTGNETVNSGYAESFTDSIDVSLSGSITGTYEGDSRGNAYQANNYYPDTWTGTTHTGGSQTGHIDFDDAAQGAVHNPYRDGVGGFAFDTDSHEMGDIDLDAALSGTVTATQWLIVMASNDASLSGGSFQNASGNIGVNISAGTGNQQANSLAMAVAQPGTGGGGGGGGGE
ncbi:MAG: adhesin [Xanthomonadales bacterium]|mgnify:CR=1 FL=1|nr:adhesin [Xanthomonadales bacterium]ODU94252.1 MAG: hypothetical protein ABT18_03645 [Rhodanobacter sp. SCN 66-43]OJY86858.1 MAG: hypothetical protein BGP23_11780 [Xanthomonadales bacterium 66-474]